MKKIKKGNWFWIVKDGDIYYINDIKMWFDSEGFLMDCISECGEKEFEELSGIKLKQYEQIKARLEIEVK